MRAWTKDDYITPLWFLDLVRGVFRDRIVGDMAWDNPWYGMPVWMAHPMEALQGAYFCNPPYSDIPPWIEKAFRLHDSGASVLLLLPANTDTKWFHRLAKRATLCFWKGRIKFLKPLMQKRDCPSVMATVNEYEVVDCSICKGRGWAYTQEPVFPVLLEEDPAPRHLPLVAFLPRNVEDEQRFTKVFQSYGTIF